MELTLFLISTLVIAVQAGPVDTVRDACATKCSSTNKFGYKPGTSYEFDYNSKTSTSIKGASKGMLNLELTAKVHVEAISKCDYLLKISKAQLHETDPNAHESMVLSDGSQELSQILQSSDLRFSFQDGTVEEVCPASGENIWSLNIKRAILSVFQNTMDDLSQNQKVKEIDVTGNCDTEYTVSDSGRHNIIILKTKNLIGCTDRQGYRSSVRSTPYMVPSDIQTLPLMKSEHSCQQEISSEGNLKMATCLETQVFRPFSQQGSGAMTESRQTLSFVRERVTSSSLGSVRRRTNLLFEHVHNSDKASHSHVDIERKLIEICEDTMDDVRPTTPRLFTELVYLMKTVSELSLKLVYNKISLGQLCSNNNMRIRKFFLDAIPMVGTSASIRVLTTFINDKIVSGTEADMWLTSLSFIQHPTKPVLKDVLPLLNGDSGKAMLSVASLVHLYCKEHSCENDKDVENIINSMQSKIGSDCLIHDQNLKQVIMSLRSIGNAGYATSAITTINSCVTNADNPIEVRLAAVEAFRRMPCNGNRSELITIFLNQHEDSELRIAAYLALMNCADERVLQIIKESLHAEEINQVRSFVWSHLTNLKQTSNPLKQDIRLILENEDLRKEFDLDKRKFSRNYEWSFFQEKLNTGASAESNLIWSKDSFIPRSASANLTVDLFGRSINLLEIGGRVKGLEHFLESYFGPYGYFGDNSDRPNEKKPSRPLISGINKKKMKNIDRQFSSDIDELKGAMYMRVFGNELGYKMFDGKETMKDDDFNILQMLITLSKSKDYSISQSLMFMDSSIIIPTSSGFPMTLNINGTANIDLKVMGKFDVRKFATSPRSMSIDGSVEPSAAIQISSMMSIDAFVTKSGLKMVSTLHTSTALQGRIELQNGRIFSSEIDIPRQKMEIFNLRTHFFTVHRNVEKEQQMITENRQTKEFCSGSKIAKVIGLELCGEISFPNASLKADAPYFPLTGPVSMGIQLVKRDTHDKYKFESRFTKSSDSNVIRVLFDTPGSFVDRKMEVDVTLDKIQKVLKMSLTSPWKMILLSGSITDNTTLQQLQGSFVIDNEPKVAVLAEVRKSKNGASYVYTPKFEVQIPQNQTISLTGSMEYQPRKFFEVAFTVAGVLQEPINLKGNFQHQKFAKIIECDISFQKGKVYSAVARLQQSFSRKAINIKPYLLIRTPAKDLLTFVGSFIYKVHKSLTIDMTVSKIVAKDLKIFVRLRQRSNRRYQTSIYIKTPILVTKLRSSIGLRRSENANIRTTLEYVLPRVFRDRLSFNGKIAAASIRGLKKLKGNLKLVSRHLPNCNFHLIVDASTNQKKTDADISLNYGFSNVQNTRRIMFSTSMVHQVSWTMPNIAFSSRFQHLGYGLDIKSEAKHTHSNKQLTNTFDLLSGENTLVSTAIYLTNKPKQKSGNIKIVYPGRVVKVSNHLTRNDIGDYSNILNIQYQQGKKSIVKVSYGHPMDKVIVALADVDISDMKRVKLFGEFGMKNTNKFINTSVILGQDNYSLTAKLIHEPSEYGVSTDIQWPARRVTIDLYTKCGLPIFMGKADIKWNADSDISKRFLLDYKAVIENKNNIDAYFNHQSPLGTSRVDIKHRGGNIFVTNLAVEWGNFHRITVDTTFSQKHNNIAQHVLGIVKITSPFRGYRNIDIDTNYQSDVKQIISNFVFKWKPMKPISMHLNWKHPNKLSSFGGSVVLNTPFAKIKKTSFEFAHSLRNDILKSTSKFTWNRNLVQLRFDGTRKVFDGSRDFIGRINFKSPIKGFESVFINGRYFSDESKYQNSLTFERNAEGISYALELLHQRTGWEILNKGRVLITLSSGEVSSEWSHQNTDSQINSSISNHWGPHSLEMELRGDQSITFGRGTATSSLNVRGSVVPEINFLLSHHHDIGKANSMIKLKKENYNILSIGNNYQRANGKLESTHELEIFDKSYLMELETAYIPYPLTTKMKLQWAPDKKVSVESALGVNNNLYNGKFELISHVESLENIVILLNQNRRLQTTFTTLSLQYHPEKTLLLEQSYRWDSSKQIRFSMKTPFSRLRSIKSGVDFTGNLQTFSFNSVIEIKPIFSAVSLSSRCSLIGGILFSMELRTPYQNFAYSKMELSSVTEEHMRKNTVTIEYQPTKVIRFQNTYRMDSENMMASISVSTPFEFARRIAATSTFTGSINKFRSSIHLEGINNELYEGEFTLSNDKKILGTISINSPYFDDIVGVVSHEHSNHHYKTNGELQYQNGRKFQIDTTFNLNDDFEGNVVIKSPFWSDLSASIYHSGNFNLFETRADMQYGKKHSRLAVNFANENTVAGSVLLTCPLINKMAATFVHSGGINNFQLQGEFEYMRGQKIVTMVTFKNIDKIQGTFHFISPFTHPVEASVEHLGSIGNFYTNIRGLDHNGRTFYLDAKFGMNENLEGIFKLKTPFSEEVIMNVFQSIDTEQIQSHLIFQYHPNRIFETDMHFYNRQGIDFSLGIRTPFTDEITASFNYVRNPLNVTFLTNMRYGRKLFELDVSFKRGRRALGSVSIKTPFTYVRSASFNFDKSMNEFQGHAEVELRQNEKYEADVNLANHLQMKGSVVLKIPNQDNFKAAFSHKGRFAKIKTTLNVLYSKNQKFYLDFCFGLKPNREVIISLTTPFRGYNKLRFSTSHRGTWKDFTVKTMISRGRSAITSNIIFKRKPVIHGEISVITPITGYRNLGAMFTHNTSSTYFHSKAEIKFPKNRKLASNVFVEKQPFMFVTIIETPFKGLELQKLLLANEGSLQTFQSIAEISWGKRKKIGMTAKVDTKSSVEVKIGLQSSFKRLEHLGLTLLHSGSLQRFSSYAEVSLGKKIIGGNFVFTSTDSISGSLTIKTPFRGYRLSKLTFSNDGTLNNFRSYADLLFMGRKSELDLTFSTLNNIECLLSIKSAYFSPIKSLFYYSSTRRRLKSHVSTHYGSMELIYGQIAFVSRRKTILTATLRSAWTKMTEANIIHEGSLTKFQTKMQVFHDNNQNSKLELILDSTNYISSKLKIAMPYKGMESLRSSLIVKGRLSRFQGHWEGSINSRTVEVDILCNLIDRKRASFSVKTPFKTFYNINANIILEEQSIEIKISKDKEIVKGLIEVSYENGLTARANLQTPWASDIVAKVSHSGSLQRFLTSGEIIYSGRKQIAADASFESSPSILLKSSLLTPSEILRNVKVTLHHDGYFPSFITSAELSINANIISGQMNLQTNDGIEGKFLLQTPYTSDLMISFTQNGQPISMRTATEITYNNVKEVTFNTHWDLQSQKEIFFDLKTPIHGFENVAVLLSLVGDGQNLEINSAVTYYRDRTVIIKARVIQGQNQEVSLEIQAPFISDIKALCANKGSSGVDAVISVLYDGHEKVHTKATVSYDATFAMSLISRSVFTGLENIQINFKYQYDDNVFKTNAYLLKNEQRYAVDVELSNTVRKYIVFNVNSPLTRTISTSIVFQNVNKTLMSSVESQLGDHASSGEVSISWRNSYDAFFNLTNIASFFVENANQVYGKFSHSGDVNQMRSYAELSYLPLEKFTAQILLSENAGKVLVTTPFIDYQELSSQFTKLVSPDKQECKAEITFAQGNKIEVETTFKTGDIDERLITIKTPFKDYESFSSSFRRESLSDGFSSGIQITDSQDQLYEASILMKTSSGFESVITLKTPFTGFEKISSSIKQHWDQNAFTCHAEVTNKEENIVESRILFKSKSEFKGSMRIKVPVEGLRDIVASFDHKRSPTSIISRANLQYGFGKKIELRVSIQKINKLISEVILKTPFSGYEHSKVVFSHSWMDGNLQSLIELESVRKFEGAIELTTAVPVTLYLSTKTPFDGYRVFESRASYIASPKGITSNAQLQVNDKKFETEIDVALEPTLNTTVLIKTPFSEWRTLFASIYHTGSFTDHLSNVELLFGNQAKIIATSEMKSTNGLESRTSLTTPFPGASYTELFLSFSGNKAHAEVIYGNRKKLETDISFQAIDKIEGSIMIRTPFSGYEVSQASLIFENTNSGITTLVEMINNDQRIKGEMDVIISEIFSVTSSLSTPYENLQNVGLNLRFRGDIHNAKVDIILLQREQRALSMTIKHVMDSYRMDHAIKVSSLYFDDVLISIYHNGNWNSFSSSAVFSIGSDSTNHNLVSNIDANSIHFNYEATATIRGNHYISKTALSHEGDWHNFKTIFVNELNGRKDLALEAIFRNIDVIEGTLILKSSFRNLRHINAGFYHTGDISQFKTKGFIKYSVQKQIQISMDFFKHRFSRINGNFQMKTPFEGLEETLISVRHNINKNGFKCVTESVYGVKQRVKADVKLMWKPFTFEAAITSPFVGFEEMLLNAKYTKQEFSTNIDVWLKYATGKDIKFHSFLASENRPIALTMTLSTPFPGYENTEITYTHTGNMYEFTCNAELHASYTTSISGYLSYRIHSPDDLKIMCSFSSPFHGFKMLNFLVRTQRQENLFLSHSEISWSVTDKVSLDLSLNSTENMDTEYSNIDLTLATPFQSIRSMSIKSQYQQAPSFYKETLVAEYDNTKLIDTEMEIGSVSSYVISMVSRKPLAFSFVLKGQSLDTKINGDVYLDWNTEDKHSNIRVQTSLGNQDVSWKVIHPKKTVEVTGSLSRTMHRQTGSGIILIDGSRTFGLDCEFVSLHKHLSNLVVLYLPHRNINLYGILSEQDESRIFEASLMWDAENDTSKKLAMNANLVPDGESRKANLTVIIGRDVKVDSEIVLNHGNILLGGRTELHYSADATKHLIIHSRVEDVSSAFGKNISLMLGLTHKYSSLDIQMVSHVAHATDKYTAGVDFQYLTAERNKHNVRLMGEIDSLKKQMHVDIESPMKSMKVSGAVNTKNPYRLSIEKNDDKPIMATLSLDRNSPLIDITFSNDIENTSRVFHIIAGYVNNSAVEAKMYHQKGSEINTTFLLAVHLNAPEKLHTRIIWNPTVIADFKNEGLRQIESNSRSVDTTLQCVADFLRDEMEFKYRAIRNEMIGQIQLPVEFAKSYIQEIHQSVIVANSKLQTFLQEDTIFPKSMCRNSEILLQKLDNVCSQMLTQLDTISMDLEASKNVKTDFPWKEQLEAYKQRISRSISEICTDGQVIYEQLVDNVHTTIGAISRESMETLDKYQNLATELVSKVSSASALELLESKCNQYLGYATEISLPPFMKDNANKYFSEAEDTINKQLFRILQQPELQYIGSQANEAYQLGIAAVKFWKVDETINVVKTLVNNYIAEIIDTEIEKIRDVTSYFSSKITEYEPALGKIQIHTSLPVSMSSLKVLPRVDITRRLNRLKPYIPDISKISYYVPSMDFADNIPPFKASATVTENLFNTFDGKTYQLDGRCSYVLAKDFVDAHFSAVLHFMEGNKRKLILSTRTMSIQLLSNGNVQVEESTVVLPYVTNEIRINKQENIIIVKGSGFTLTYDIPNVTFKLTLSGWFYNKTGGLLGTYDNEKYDDFLTPSNRIVRTINDFANAWEVGENC